MLYLRILTIGFILITACLTTISLQAHAPDQGYLYMRIYKDAIGGRFELIAKDINQAIGSELPDDLTMEQLKVHLPAIQAYFKQRSSFKGSDGSTYSVQFREPEILDLEEMEDFVRFHFDLEGVNEVPESMDIMYNVLFDVNPKHRGLLIIEYNWKAGILDNEALSAFVYTPSETRTDLSLTDASVWKGFWNLVRLGIWHIWIGLDHILFIVALILPSVVRRKEEKPELTATNYSSNWTPVPRFRPAFLYILKVITFFTIAHSITLAVAALGWVNLSSRLVESIIAVSIALAAFHNIRPIFPGKEWMIAFGFGLFHGFGFASVLGEKGLSGDYLIPSLLGFNLGVEIGQVLIICLIFPILYFIRRQRAYPKLITYGSVVLILIALQWTMERAFDLQFRFGALFKNLLD
jgi:hypothetical protein